MQYGLRTTVEEGNVTMCSSYLCHIGNGQNISNCLFLVTTHYPKVKEYSSKEEMERKYTDTELYMEE